MDDLKRKIGNKTAWKAPKNAARVEPKTYFANERTFIQWVSAALFLVTTAALLLEFENGEGYAKTTSKTLLVFALIIATYSLGLYYFRIWLMRNGRPYGYTSHFGPLVLSGAAIAGTWIILSKLRSMELSDVVKRNNIDNNAIETEVRVIRPEAGVCMQHDVSAFSPLEFEPSDALVDEERNLLLVPTQSDIYGFPLPEWNDQGKLELPQNVIPTVVVQLDRADFESVSLLNNNNRMYVVSEVNTISQDSAANMYSFERNAFGDFEISGQWKLAVPGAEGMTFVQQGNDASFFISGQYGTGPNSAIIQKFPIPEPNGWNNNVISTGEDQYSSMPTLTPIRRLNKKLLDESMEDPKIGAMTYFEGILYILHDNARVVRAWDIATGEYRGTFSLPGVPNSTGKQWEGMALQRIPRTSSALRGSENDSVLVLHLTHDTPASIWSIVVEEDSVPGSIILPACARAE